MKSTDIYNMISILESFLGKSKNGMDDSYQMQFSCPRCIEEKGDSEKGKFNLEINLSKQMFNCWSCSQTNDDMHGSVLKLIKKYGGNKTLSSYIEAVKSFRESTYYQLNFSEQDFKITEKNEQENFVTLPTGYKSMTEGYGKYFDKASYYLSQRGIGEKIIKEYSIGYVGFSEKEKILSSRIILPSFGTDGDINYWTGRDFSGSKYRQKYFNPKVERKKLIFNEAKIEWNANITLVEGPFDHIVVPNSIPLLGKVLRNDFSIYSSLMEKANANVNIFLDGDAFQSVKSIYKLIDNGPLKGRVRYIPVSKELDPSEIYKIGREKWIISHLINASKISECYLS